MTGACGSRFSSRAGLSAQGRISGARWRRRCAACPAAMKFVVDFSADVAALGKSCGSSEAQGAAAGRPPREKNLASGVSQHHRVAWARGAWANRPLRSTWPGLGRRRRARRAARRRYLRPQHPTMNGPRRTAAGGRPPDSALEKHGIKAISMGLFIRPARRSSGAGRCSTTPCASSWAMWNGASSITWWSTAPRHGPTWQISLVQLVPLAAPCHRHHAPGRFARGRAQGIGDVQSDARSRSSASSRKNVIFHLRRLRRAPRHLRYRRRRAHRDRAGCSLPGTHPDRHRGARRGRRGWPSGRPAESEASRMFVQVASNLAGRLSVLNLQHEGANAPE